jgi:hypothetical protein
LKDKNKNRTEPKNRNSTKVAVCAGKWKTGTTAAFHCALLQFLFQKTKLCGPRKTSSFSFHISILIVHFQTPHHGEPSTVVRKKD